MRLLFVLSVTSLVAAAATFACSSGDSTAAPADAGKDAKPVAKTGDDDDDDKTTTPPATTDPDASTSDASDAGATGPGGNLVTTGDGGTACDDESFREAETNNTAETANKLTVKIGTTKMCGQVTSADPDFLTFKMPDDAHGFFVQPSGGGFKISGTIDGQPFQGTNFGGIEVNQGATWVVKVETGSADARAWRLSFQFDQ
jgi:hypothetical protein